MTAIATYLDQVKSYETVQEAFEDVPYQSDKDKPVVLSIVSKNGVWSFGPYPNTSKANGYERKEVDNE